MALRYVQIQTHSRCNADCVFCPYVESWHAAHPGTMDDTLWARLLDELRPFAEGLSRGMVAPYLMNEPLLDPRIFDRIEDIYRVFPRTMVALSTNGAALTPRNTERLLAAFGITTGRPRKAQLWVSHHGVDADSMGEIMRLDHDRALANLLHLLREARGRLRVLIRGSGTQRGRPPRWFTPARYRAWWGELFEQHGIDTTRVHVDAFEFHDRAGALQRADRGAGAMSVGRVRTIDADHPFACSRVDEWLHVLWDGRVRLCCMDYKGEVPLPGLRDMTIAEVLDSAERRRVLARLRGELREPADFICERCVSPGG